MASPTPQSSSTEDPVLSFDWAGSKWFKDPLFRFLLVSALSHLLIFMLLQVVSTEKVTAPDREREMQFLSSEVPEHKALLDAIEAETPLGALSHQLLPVDSLLVRPYASAFMDSKPAPKEVALWKNPPGIILPIQTLPLGGTAVSQPSPHAPPFKGRLVVNETLAGRLLKAPETPESPLGKALENTEFLVGVSGSGEVKFVILQKSSGDGRADAGAEHFMRQISFSHAEQEIAWGQVRLEWGSPVR